MNIDNQNESFSKKYFTLDEKTGDPSPAMKKVVLGTMGGVLAAVGFLEVEPKIKVPAAAKTLIYAGGVAAGIILSGRIYEGRDEELRQM